MTTQPNLKSAGITAKDATPPTRRTVGADGGEAHVIEAVGIVGPTTDGDTTGGILRAVRVPSNAKIRSIAVAQVAATTTASFDCGLYYSDADDGTSVGNRGLAADADCFATAVDTHALITWTELAFEAGTYNVSDTENAIWKLSTLVDGAGVALASDPGGFFDIVLVNKATISGAATVALRVQYVNG